MVTDISKAAAEYADSNVDCSCSPDHYLYGTGTCWFHLSKTEQATYAFKAGAEHALECPEVTAMREALAHADRYIDYAMEFGDTSKNTVGIECVKEALAAFDALKKGK